MNKKKIVIVLIKLIVLGLVIYADMFVGIISTLCLMDLGINQNLAFCSIIILPLIAITLLFFLKKKPVVICSFSLIILYCIGIGINYIGIRHEEAITIKTDVNIDTSEYLPFDENSKIYKLRNSSLKLEDNLPRIDGAAAVFPVYSSFVNAVYPEDTVLDGGIFNYSNTIGGYRSLAEKEIDIFFGAYPSEEQIDYATENGTEFEYIPIGTEAFVFFVNKDNSVDNLTSDQIKGIYSGKITNWKEVGGKDEEIVAFQRNNGSGSQSMLKRFMNGTTIMTPPTEQVNEFMVGIIDVVANYKNRTNAIGFSFRYYMEGIIKNPDVKLLSVDGVYPDVKNIQLGNYPITTSLYAVTYKDNPNENVKIFIDWILSSEGQKIIKETGYTPIN